MSEELAIAAAEWIADGKNDSFASVVSAIPVRIVIPRGGPEEASRRYYGVRVVTTSAFKSMDLSVRANHVTYGTPYHDMSFYVLGQLPFGDQPNSKILFRLDKGSSDWFISIRSLPTITESAKPFHPFGPNWILTRWAHEEIGCRMDEHENPRQRRTFKFAPIYTHVSLQRAITPVKPTEETLLPEIAHECAGQL